MVETTTQVYRVVKDRIEDRLDEEGLIVQLNNVVQAGGVRAFCRARHPVREKKRQTCIDEQTANQLKREAKREKRREKLEALARETEDTTLGVFDTITETIQDGSVVQWAADRTRKTEVTEKITYKKDGSVWVEKRRVLDGVLRTEFRDPQCFLNCPRGEGMGFSGERAGYDNDILGNGDPTWMFVGPEQAGGAGGTPVEAKSWRLLQ